jgi:hypothetical protein
MNDKLLILFVILLLGLILCSFLGGKGTVEGFTASASEQSDGTIIVTINGNSVTLTKNSDGSYTGPNGYSAIVNSDGTLTVTSPDGSKTTTTTNSSSSSPSSTSTSTSTSTTSSPSYDDYNHYSGASTTTYYGPNGGTAKIVDNGGQDKAIIVRLPSGKTYSYYISNDGSSNINSATYTGPNGTATIVTDGNGRAAIKVTIDGTSTIYTIDANSNSIDSTINQGGSTTTTTGTDYNNAYVYTGPNGNTAAAVTGPNGNTVAATNYNSSAYYNSLPPGITANQIPAGQEDLYILKSQVVPPVCPKCPDPIIQSSDSSDTSKCPPCPPCARCPEPAFDCKKVPNYNSFNPAYMPMPVLSDFSSFGM